MTKFETAVFGNRAGSHQLLESSLPASTPVLDVLRFLVDRPAGHIGPEVKWFPYWGCQQIERWWVLWRGEEDFNAPRKNMVVARVALLSVDACARVDDLDVLLLAVGGGAADPGMMDLSLAAAIVDCLAKREGPALVADLATAPNLLRAIWPRLWTSARASVSLRTVFGPECLDSLSPSSIAVIPAELKPRWHGHKLIMQSSGNHGTTAQWFVGNASLRVNRIIDDNMDHLPGDFSVLERVTRVAERLDRLIAGTGTSGDALVIIRTQEAIAGGLLLPSMTSDMSRSAKSASPPASGCDRLEQSLSTQSIRGRVDPRALTSKFGHSRSRHIAIIASTTPSPTLGGAYAASQFSVAFESSR